MDIERRPPTFANFWPILMVGTLVFAGGPVLMLALKDTPQQASVTRTADGFGNPGATVTGTIRVAGEIDPLLAVGNDLAPRQGICDGRRYQIESLTITANAANIQYEAKVRCRI